MADKSPLPFSYRTLGNLGAFLITDKIPSFFRFACVYL